MMNNTQKMNNLERLFSILYYKYDRDITKPIIKFLDTNLHMHIARRNDIKSYMFSEIEFYEE